MSFVTSWGTPDHRVLLNFASPAIAVFERHIQARDTGTEAGGLLLGTVHGSNIAVSEATAPTRWDKRFLFLFERMPFGHASVARLRWKASGGIVRYIGEWHTHPQDYPAPSSLDRIEWNKLARKRADGRPVLGVIVGRKGLYIEIVPASGEGPAMVPME